ncbi:MAG TPA: hypothetical protein VGM30_04300 [Puia sp.]|jgi:hypothetical protein
MFSNDTRKKLQNITGGKVIEGAADNCTTARNLLCASFRTSTAVKKDFEGQSIIKKEQAEFLKLHSAKNNSLQAVLRQPFIISDGPVDLSYVKELLAFNGFTNTRRDDYYNEELGLILEDIHDENVIMNFDTVFFIDTVFYTVASAEVNPSQTHPSTPAAPHDTRTSHAPLPPEA